MNKITIIENGQEIREAFMNKFVLTRSAFEAKYAKWIADSAKTICPIEYDNCYLWDRMPKYQEITFAQALDCLRSLDGDVYFLSDPTSKPHCDGIRVNGVEYKGGVAKANAKSLADQIAYEWYENYRLSMLDQYVEIDCPYDLYVFDASMEHLLVFTHENDFWHLEIDQPTTVAPSRYCMASGFAVPAFTSYERIRLLLTGELQPNTAIEVELTFSSPKQFRTITVSKRTNKDNTGYVFRFALAPETDYPTLEELENAGVFDGQSLKALSEINPAGFVIKKLNGSNCDVYT